MRNSLIITVGTTPQIVTETVHALLKRSNPFVPHEIYLVTTTKAASVFEPFTKPGSKLEQLYEHLCRAQSYVAPILVPVVDKHGAEVADVRTEAEAIAFGNTVTKLVAKLAEIPDNRIHVSLAGGRKTMGWYAGTALSLFGRDHDELSHVLVEHTAGEPDALEGCEDFWWPTERDEWLPHKYWRDKDGNPRLYNARNGHIDLALIPFVRLKLILRETAFPGGEVDYEAVVAGVEESLAVYRLRLVVDDRTVIVGRHRFQLGHRNFALYALLAKARKERRAPARGTGLNRDHYFGWISLHDLGSVDSPYLRTYYELLCACHSASSKSAEELLDDAVEQLHQNSRKFLHEFSVLKSRISGSEGQFMQKMPNPTIRDRIDIKTVENAEGLSCFGLLLEPSQIEIVESE